MASAPNVLPIFPEPDGNNSASAIADAIRRTKCAEGFTNAELAFQLRCDASTIENAEAKRNLLKFDTVARLLRKYPEHTGVIRQLWEMTPVDARTAADDLVEAQRLIDRAKAKMEAAQ